VVLASTLLAQSFLHIGVGLRQSPTCFAALATSGLDVKRVVTVLTPPGAPTVCRSAGLIRRAEAIWITGRLVLYAGESLNVDVTGMFWREGAIFWSCQGIYGAISPPARLDVPLR